MVTDLLERGLRRVLRTFDRDAVWRVPTTTREVFLTFDDGPMPGLTPWVLEQLQRHGARATFFCLGRHVQEHPELFQRIVREGHAVGNHTWDHPDGWRTPRAAYVANVERGRQASGAALFRPPYGRLTPAQWRAVRRQHTLAMWDVLSRDFDPRVTPEDCVDRVVRKVRPGSIVVFHDNPKSERTLRAALPVVLERLGREGYAFSALASPIKVPPRP